MMIPFGYTEEEWLSDQAERKPYTYLPEDVIREVAMWYDMGRNVNDIAEDYGVSKSTIYNALKKFRDNP